MLRGRGKHFEIPTMRYPMLKLTATVVAVTFSLSLSTQVSSDKIQKLKAEVIAEIDKQYALAQQINDMLFSYAELGFQEVETAKYLTDLLAKNGFTIQRGIANIPTAWTATWEMENR